eukprot:CAMPEP_0198228650 /NCGR_PEP_ID=MMETSP1445-20131203/113698_1 /TAXON_ID=36898 /ORGANISM="Pyramimonas sp., Strain CCMP2087" /LENGTH=531 /DNA_ID=CAMNT_0043909063 /DNA_START=88 /DNA_END=1684 /DNA_ORIENTATION=-
MNSCASLTSSRSAFAGRAPFSSKGALKAVAPLRSALKVSAEAVTPLMIGLAADSGCGKSTFMRRITACFGGDPKPPKGGNPDSNTLLSDLTTVVCLDDYHSSDRKGRQKEGVTALNPKAQNFDLMYEQCAAIKAGGSIQKPIYNHVSGLLDPPEEINAAPIYVIEGLHPFYDERVRALLDFKIYLDISDDVKFAWKIQRDMAERGHSLESIKASIEARKPDFDAYTALNPCAQNFDLMYEHCAAIKAGKSIQKPIYNHVTGLLDPTEEIHAAPIYVIEGLHPFYDERVRDLLDFKLYLDISDDVKFAWKIQRDMAERGHSLESIKASIEARKPDFDAYIDPQKQLADVIIQVLPTQLIPDDNEGKVLRVRLIQKEGVKNFDPTYLFDEGSTISWIPCGRKLSCSYPGIKFFYGPDTYYGQEVSVLEMDGQFDKLEELIYVESHLSNTSTKFYGEITQQMLRAFDKLEELIYVESHLSNTSTKFYGEITQQMLKLATFPGSNNGTGLFQTIVGLKVREVYEKFAKKEVSVSA